RAAQRVAHARVVNAGQVCVSPDVVHVPASATKSFVQDVFATWGEVMPEMFEADDVTTLIDDDAYERITALLEHAEHKGAQVLTSVRSDESGQEALRAARILPPTVVLGVTKEMTISREEVFGPVLSVHSYTEVDDVIDELAEQRAPLVATWYGPDDAD